MSKIEVNTVEPQCGTTLTLGASGDKVSLPSGVTLSGVGTVSWDTTPKTATFTGVSGNGYFVNTTAGVVTANLPASPSAGDIMAVLDYAGTADTNNITVGRNGSNINGAASDLTISKENSGIILVYVDGTQGWKNTETSNINDITLIPTFITATGGTETTSGNFKIHTFTGPGTFTVSNAGNSSGSNSVDYTNTFQTNNLTISPNGSDKIGGTAEDATLDTEGQSVTFVYVDATEGWKNIQDSTSNVTGTSPFIVATGGTETTSGNFKIHTFTGPGTFTVTGAGVPGLPAPTSSTTVDYLVIGGGGGGAGGTAYNCGSVGGGGAGGYRESSGAASGCYTRSPLGACVSALPVSVQGYPITVGAGAAAQTCTGPNCSTPGIRGSDSSFSTIISAAGGGGKAATPNATSTGGSGGGGNYQCSSGGAGNTPPVSPPQGNNGGAGSPSGPPYASGGGGGAGAVGGAYSPGTSGSGGAGVASSITASPVTRAGGGGGGGSNSISPGSGGSGGGGAGGSPSTLAGDGTANTGGGGGAANTNPHPAPGTTTGAGGSGIVVIRYRFQ